ncbi:MAG: D-aminoacyl-tRNA deacylase [Candidatus Bathyarchaeia archaeon]
MILVVASTKDVASMNIRRQLLEHYDFEETAEKFCGHLVYQSLNGDKEVKLVTINEEAIYYQDITEGFDPQLTIFLSRHSSKSGTPTLSVHTPGNLGVAQKGGIPKKISVAPAKAMRQALIEMARQRSTLELNSYKISYECTHHGPSLDVATMFVELGSSPAQWKDTKAAEAVAHAAMTATSENSNRSTVALGIGGPHYNEKFTRIALENSIAFGHIIPKYAVSQVDAELISQCIKRTVEKVDTIVLDWKGIKGSDKTRLAKAINVGVPVQKV